MRANETMAVDVFDGSDCTKLTPGSRPPGLARKVSQDVLQRSKMHFRQLYTDEGLTITHAGCAATDGKGPPHGFYGDKGPWKGEDGCDYIDPPRILTYRPAHMKQVLALITQIDLTPFNFYRSWFVTAFFAGVTGAIAWAGTPSAAVQHERVLAIELLSTSLATLTAFVLGGFISKIVSNWNRRRAIYDGLMGQATTTIEHSPQPCSSMLDPPD